VKNASRVHSYIVLEPGSADSNKNHIFGRTPQFNVNDVGGVGITSSLGQLLWVFFLINSGFATCIDWPPTLRVFDFFWGLSRPGVSVNLIPWPQLFK